MFLNRGLTRAEAEDLACSCVTDIALKIDSYHYIQDGGFRAWCFTLARRAFVNYWRQYHPTETLPPELPETQREEYEVETRSHLASAVDTAMGQLDDRSRKIVELKALYGATSEEIARTLNITQAHARVLYLRARRKLQRLLRHNPRVAARLARKSTYEHPEESTVQ